MIPTGATSRAGTYRLVTMLTALLVPLSPALAAGKKAAKAHEHGVATLDIAVDDKVVTLVLLSPAESVWGFEHEAKSPKDKAAVEAAMGRLTDQKRFQELFAFAKESDCQCTGVSTDTSHTSTSGSKTSKSSKAGDHHEEHSEAHSEVRVEYSVRCATAPAGTKLKLDIFQHFKGLKSLKVQVVGATQSGMKATPAANLVPL